MTEVIAFMDWSDSDSRYKEEKRRVTDKIKKIAAEHGFTHATVQPLLIKERYRLFSLHVTVDFMKEGWLEDKCVNRYVPARIWFTEDCELADKMPNPEWCDEVVEVK